MNRASKVRGRGSRLVRATLVVGLLLVGWGVFTGERSESAPARRSEVVEELVSGPAGGVAAALPSDVAAVAYATRRPDGGLTVGCTDSQTAAGLVAGVAP